MIKPIETASDKVAQDLPESYSFEEPAAQALLQGARVEALRHRLNQVQADYAAREAVLARSLADYIARASAAEAELARVYTSRSWRLVHRLRRLLGR